MSSRISLLRFFNTPLAHAYDADDKLENKRESMVGLSCVRESLARALGSRLRSALWRGGGLCRKENGAFGAGGVSRAWAGGDPWTIGKMEDNWVELGKGVNGRSKGGLGEEVGVGATGMLVIVWVNWNGEDRT
jgi:hypothetical protein